MSTAYEGTIDLGGIRSIRIQLMPSVHGVNRVDVRRFDGLSPAEGINVSLRHLPALREALCAAEAAARIAGLLK